MITNQNQIDSNKINQNELNQKDSNRPEKIIIIYIIIINLILIFFSLFFIHYIISKGVAKDTKTIGITYPEKKDEDDEIINYTDRFIVKQDKDRKQWESLKQLDMFKNDYFKDKALIAPGVQGKYSFTVENESEATFNYNINFTPENPYNVNMVYKLKKNGKYVLGDEEKWESYEGLRRINQKLSSSSIDVYTVEWRWEDTDYDTPIGETEGAYYKMYVDVIAEQVTP